MTIKTIIGALALSIASLSAQAATLGLATSAPTVGADGVVDYLEFGPDGDLSMFGVPVHTSSLTTIGAGAEVGFGIGFSLSDPESGASGGFEIYDDQGLYLSGDLLALGFRAFRAFDGLIELHFGSLTGRGVSEWTDTLLMTVIFDGTGEDVFGSFFDGEFYDVEIGMFAVTSDAPPPSPIPLPDSAFLLLAGLGTMAAGRLSLKRRTP